ncbi:MAG: tetratricopeptide repeat protein [Nitrospinaceae bacterium]
MKKPDAFQKATRQFIGQMGHNRLALIGIVGGIILLAAAISFFLSGRKQQSLEMERLYFEMTELRDKGQGKDPQTVLDQMQSKLTAFDDGSQKQRAQLLLADTYFQYEKYDPAVKIYESLLRLAPEKEMNYGLARRGLAAVYEAQKEFPKAIAAYKSIIDRPDSLSLFYVQLGLARSHEKNGDKKSARLVLRDMEAKFPNHAGLDQVKSMLDRLSK